MLRNVKMYFDRANAALILSDTDISNVTILDIILGKLEEKVARSARTNTVLSDIYIIWDSALPKEVSEELKRRNINISLISSKAQYVHKIGF